MKKNLRFFARFAAILLTVVILVGIINIQYVSGYYYSDVYGEVQKFNDVPEHITFANFGTSHGLAAFRYDENDKSSFNFALSGEDIYHDYQTLKQFADHLDEGCIVSIPVSYFSFCLSTEEPSQKRYYNYLDRKYIRDFSYETLINTKYLPVLRSIEFLFKDLIGDQELNSENCMDAPAEAKVPALGIATDIVAYAEEGTDANEELAQLHISHAKTRAESWRSGRMVVGKKNMPENTKLLTDMVNFCIKHKFKPVLVTIPVYSALTNDFTKEELDYYYYSNLHKVVKDTGVLYIDYSKDKRLVDNPAYYNNSDHMSEEGANAFMQIYREDLNKRGVTVK